MDDAFAEIVAADQPHGRIPGTALVSFEFSPAQHGWIDMTVRADDRSDAISCSHVYDPFQDIVTLISGALSGVPGCAEVDEEGLSTFIRIDVEPGELAGRLRVFEPGVRGEVETGHIDAQVDIVQLAHAWLSAFRPYVEGYDPRHWTPTFPEEDEEAPRTLATVDLMPIEVDLEAFGRLARPPREGDDNSLLGHLRMMRDRYAAARGEV